MDADTLRARQAPLKDRYREDPASARVTSGARGDFRDPGITAMGVAVDNVELAATCTWDARGTLGIDRDVPVGISDVVVTITVDSDADEARLDRIATSTERYCVVGRSLATPPRITVVRRG